MKTQWMVVMLLSACGGKKDDKPAAKAADTPAAAETKPAEKPPEKPAEPPAPKAAAAPDMSHGQCHIVGTGAVTFDQTVPNTGMATFTVMQWHKPELRQQMHYADEGFIMNCTGPNIRLSVMTSPETAEKDTFPMKPATYEIGRGKGKKIIVLGSIKPADGGNNVGILDAEGTFEVTAFDASHMAGKGDVLIKRTSPASSGDIKLALDFDLSCYGQSGCPK